MSDTRYRPKGRMDKENVYRRRRENQRRRRLNRMRVKQGLDALRFRGTEAWMTW